MANQSEKEFLIRVKADIQQALNELKRLPKEVQGAADATTKAASQNQTAINGVIGALESQKRAYGKSTKEITAYNLNLLGATDAEIKRAAALIKSTESQRKQTDAMKAGREIYAATRTTQERLANELARINKLYKKGAFGAVGNAKAVETLGRATAKAKKEAKGAATNMNAMGRGMKNLTIAAMAYISLRSVNNVIKQADAFNVLNVRIRTATKDTGDYVEVQRALYETTQKNGQEFATTVSLFQQLSRSAKDLNSNNTDMLKFVNIVEQLGVIGGSTKAAQNAGLIQLSQGLAEGVFRAQEYASLLENLPELASRLRKGLGKSTSELRQMVNDGKLLSRDVFDALLKQSEDINKEFSEIPDAVERSSTRMETSFSRMLTVLDKTVDATGKVSKFYNNLAENTFDYISIKFGDDDLAKLELKRKEIEGMLLSIAQGGQIKSDAFKTYLRGVVKVREEIEAIQAAKKKAEGGSGVAANDDGAAPIKANENQDTINKLIEGLKKQRDELGQTKEAIALYKLELMGATPEEIKIAEASAATTKAKREHDEAMKEKVQNQEAIDSVIASLKEERDTFDLTGDAVELYKLKLMGATPEELKLASAITATTQAKRDHDEAMAKGQAIIESNRTAQEKYAAALAETNRLYEKGAFGAVGSAEALEQVARESEKAKKELDDFNTKGKSTFNELTAAVNGWGNQFTTTLADMVQQGKLDFSTLADSIISDLLRIAIQQTITTPFLKMLPLSMGGEASVHHAGGMAGTGPKRSVNPFLFAGAPRFHSGGFPGLSANEVPAILQKGELVLTGKQVAAAGAGGAGGAGGGTLRIEIENKGSPKQSTQATASTDIDGRVISIVLDDIDRGGPLRSRIQEVGSS